MSRTDTVELRRLWEVKESSPSGLDAGLSDAECAWMDAMEQSFPAMLDELEATRAENERLTDVIFQGEGIDAVGELGITRANFREWLRERDEELQAARDEVRSAKAAMRMMDQSIEGLESALGKQLGVPEDQAVWKWLLKRYRRQKLIGAAEELERSAATLREDLADMNPPEFASRGKVAPGYCECLKDVADGMEERAATMRQEAEK